LPFDNNTSIYAQWDVADQQEDREQSEETKRFASEVGATERARLRGHLSAMRELVRVKLADDSDLEQGLAATGELGEFFEQVERAARQQGVEEHELFAQL